MEFLESNATTAALIGVALGALVGFLGAFLAARIAATQARRDRLQLARRDWLTRLANAAAEVDPIRKRLTTANLRISTNEGLRTQILETLDEQRDVRRELRAVAFLAKAGGDQPIADQCVTTEETLSEFVLAVYEVLKSIPATEAGTSAESRLAATDGALDSAVRDLMAALGSLGDRRA